MGQCRGKYVSGKMRKGKGVGVGVVGNREEEDVEVALVGKRWI